MKNSAVPNKIDQKVKIPSKLWPYQQESAWFITYYGELYYGIIVECPDYHRGFFIVQNDKIKTLNDLSDEERTPEKYHELGREIRDPSIIEEVRKGQFGRNIDHSSYPKHKSEVFKRMFVFGAGASKFCLTNSDYHQNDRPRCWPPMGDDVFNNSFAEILNKYQGVQNYLAAKNELDAVKGIQNIEEQMQADWEHFKFYRNPEKLSTYINIQYYLSELLQKCSQSVLGYKQDRNLYQLLMENLKSIIDSDPREKISLVTFNYDTILDHSVSQIFGYKFQTMDDYRNWLNRNIMLFKPHGSCNWGWKMKGEIAKGTDISNLSSQLYKNQTSLYDIYFKMIGKLDDVVANNTWGYEYHNDTEFKGRLMLDKSLIEHISPDENELYYPAILIPYKDKDEFYMPYKHFYAMQQTIEEVEELYLIGWKGSEALFNKQLKRMTGLKKLIIVNPEPKSVLQNVREYIGAKDYKVECADDFEDFVLNYMPKNMEAEKR